MRVPLHSADQTFQQTSTRIQKRQTVGAGTWEYAVRKEAPHAHDVIRILRAMYVKF